jgi:hypothetical protein
VDFLRDAARKALVGLSQAEVSPSKLSNEYKRRAAAVAAYSAEETSHGAALRHERIIGEQWASAVDGYRNQVRAPGAVVLPSRALQFRLGQAVVANTARSMVSGVVRYCGPRKDGRPGTVVGIETDTPHAGLHDGCTHARRYFVCEPGHGLIVTADRVASVFAAKPFDVGAF